VKRVPSSSGQSRRRGRPEAKASTQPAPAPRKAPAGPRARRPGAEPSRSPKQPQLALRRDDVIYGRNAVLEAARSGRVRRVLVAEGLGHDPRLGELREIASVEEVPPARIAALAQGAHQGVVAELAPRTFLTLRQLLQTSPTLLLGLDGIEDPQNLGAILRSAEAAGVGGVLLPERRSAPLSAVAVKASSGASEHLRLCRVPGLASAVPEVRRAGLWCVALDVRGDLQPWDLDLTQPSLLVVGGEEKGVHRLVRERCDARVRLPMAGRVGSLNASAATAALLYEVVRQRIRTLGGGAGAAGG
jgi:23S rRNA (guanosine2251-2'-O)-methyltransferase